MNSQDVDDIVNGDHSQYLGAKHHLIPRFYLERFAGPDGLLTTFDVDARKVTSRHPQVILSQRDFYTFLNLEMEPVASVEVLLQKVEGEAAAVFRQLSHPTFRQLPVPQDQRMAVASFLAMQILRGQRFRRTVELLTDLEQRFAVSAVSDQGLDRFLEGLGIEPDSRSRAEFQTFQAELGEVRFVSHPNEHVRLMLSLFQELWPVLYFRPMSLVEFPRPCLWTSDEPVVPIAPEVAASATDGLPSAGYGVAEHVWFPVDPWRLLVLGPLNGRSDEGLVDGTSVDPLGINVAIAASAHRFVFASHDADLGLLREVAQPRPVMVTYGLGDLPGWSDVLGVRQPQGRFRIP